MQKIVKSVSSLSFVLAAFAAFAVAVDAERTIVLEPGEKYEFQGIIVERDADVIRIKGEGRPEIDVRLTSETKVEEKKSNFFRSGKDFSAGQLMRGLLIEVEGRADASGQLVARQIKFRQDDLKVAQALQSRLMPVEGRLSETERELSDTRSRLDETRQNAERMSGQLEELTAVADAARGGAQAARESADQAIAGVTRTNERISSLDDFDVRHEVVVYFKKDSARLSAEAQELLDRVALQARDQKGYLIEVAGFASAEGNEIYNRRLSEKRADAVVQYLADNHSVPLRRIVTPYGFGENNPAADNKTRSGREQNRRAEVRILVNRGLVESAGMAEPAPEISSDSGR